LSVFSLIPFGFRVSDQKLVDVSEVKRGKRCGCICPSCKTELIARQGAINEWCFAHVSKGGADSVKNECAFSFWVSVVLMAKQIILNAKSIRVPELKLYTNQAESIPITSEKTLSFDNVEVEQRLLSIHFDVIIKLENYSIAIIFSTPERQADLSDFNIFKSSTIGILEIPLSKTDSLLSQRNIAGKYSEILSEYILGNAANKKWLYHPRKSLIEKKKGLQLFLERPYFMVSEPTPIIEQPKRQIHNKPKEPIIRDRRTIYKTTYMPNALPEIQHSDYKDADNYKCIKCGLMWFGTHVCKTCNSHFYSVIYHKR